MTALQRSVKSWWLPLLLGNVLLIEPVLGLAGGWDGTVYQGLSDLARGVALADSWWPMSLALDQLKSSPGTSLYQAIFFEQHVKFQYAPTSLLFVEIFKRTASTYAEFTHRLNSASWLLAWATVVLNVGIAHQRLRHQGKSLALVAVLLLAFYPSLSSFHLGQLQTWIAFAVAVMVWADGTGRSATAGVAAGAIGLMKPQMLPLVLWAVIRGRRVFLAGWLAIVGCGGALSLAMYGWTNHVEYLRVLSFIGQRGEVPVANQSVNGLLNRLVADGVNVEWNGREFAPYHPLVAIGTAITSLALVTVAVWPRRKTSRDGASLDLLIAVVCLTMASPIAWEHHYGILATALAVALPLARRNRTALILSIGYTLTSHYIEIAERITRTPWNIVTSYVLAGATMILYALWRLYRDAPARNDEAMVRA
jgi:alpha-1,2-mannosyltransferase